MSNPAGLFRQAVTLLSCIVIATPSPAFASWWWPFGDDGIEYSVDIEGQDEAMEQWFNTLEIATLKPNPPPTSVEELDQVGSDISERTRKALEAKGYFEAQVEYDIDRSVTPPVIHVHVMQNVRYPLSSVLLEWRERPLMNIDTGGLHSQAGAPVDMDAIEKDALQLREAIAKGQCLRSLKVTPKLRLYSATRQAELVFVIEHGPSANFGTTQITGAPNVHDEVVRREIAWKQGECFDPAKVDATRGNLIKNRLFSSARIDVADAPGPDGQVPVSVRLHERAPRTLSAGAEYSTDKGFGVNLGWEHRNLRGGAELLHSELTLAEREQSAEASLTFPAFRRDDQNLVLSSALGREETDAYEAFTLDGSALVERRFNKRFKAGAGVGYTLSHTTDVLAGESDYALISLPAFAEYDNRDNLLDARHGVLGRLDVTPYTETVGQGGQFLKTLATGYGYKSSDRLPWKPTLAGRISMGSIAGAEGDNVPPDIRFYAGGGGSVRGYSYESLSPYVAGTPVGGASLFEVSAELRLRFSEQFGGVLFFDAGNAFPDSVPDVSKSLYYGAGVGGRYYSSFGPLRVDVAFPLNGGDIDQTGFQLYVSLGQAF